MSQELPKTYDPAAVEADAYALWLRERCFTADPDRPGPSFSIVIPPPNVTGALHLGHAMNNSLQDLLCRHQRMRGANVLWVPGIDHAGIATQAVVEKQLKEQENKTRHDIGREGLVQRIWAWKQQYGDRILEQLKLLGCSCDWTRTRFTLDETCAAAVRELFFKLFRDGLIFRGKRLVNWDIHLQTSVSDDEIYHEKVKTHLWHIRYPIEGTDRHMVVATTRPETMLGDTAVAVHPKDPRWAGFIGRQVRLPLTGRLIPIVADDVLVNMEFGTGCVKVTPAHDPNDYACWQRQGGAIDIINILRPDGRINEHGAPYAGLTREQARKKVVADLAEQALLEKEEPYETDIGHSDRSKTAIEPMLSDQWFVRMAPLAEAAIQVVQKGLIHFYPARHAQQYLSWLGEKRDWPISRQLWWGHRIPIWSAVAKLDPAIPDAPAPGHELSQRKVAALHSTIGGKDWTEFTRGGGEYFLRVDSHPTLEGHVQFHVCLRHAGDELHRRLEDAGWMQDPDVLDTWFSSALWPHSTLGWPAETRELHRYYPTSVLITGRDIITLWVARMVMTGIYDMADGRALHSDAEARANCILRQEAIDEAADLAAAEPHTLPPSEARELAAVRLGLPFHHVAINPTILDGKGERMSKSKGNGVDPVDIIQGYGADALRFTLALMATETQDVRLPVKKDASGRNTSDRFDVGRNFCNKLWNAARFVFGAVAGIVPKPAAEAELSLADRWILSRLSAAVAEADAALASYRFDLYARAAYDFFWRDLCDWYLEAVKPELRDTARSATAAEVLVSCFDGALRLLHPVIPFITETIWSRLNELRPKRGIEQVMTCAPSQRLIQAPWPAPPKRFTEAEGLFGRLQEIVGALRNLRNDHKVDPRRVIDFAVADGGDAVRGEASLVLTLANARLVEAAPERASRLSAGGCELLVAALADEDAEKQRIAKRHEELSRLVAQLQGRLDNPSYAQKAPAKLVEQTRAQLAEAQAELAKLGAG